MGGPRYARPTPWLFNGEPFWVRELGESGSAERGSGGAVGPIGSIETYGTYAQMSSGRSRFEEDGAVVPNAQHALPGPSREELPPLTNPQLSESTLRLCGRSPMSKRYSRSLLVEAAGEVFLTEDIAGEEAFCCCR